MKQRFRLYRRNGGIYYIHDDETGKQESLHTRERAEGLRAVRRQNPIATGRRI